MVGISVVILAIWVAFLPHGAIILAFRWDLESGGDILKVKRKYISYVCTEFLSRYPRPMGREKHIRKHKRVETRCRNVGIRTYIYENFSREPKQRVGNLHKMHSVKRITG